MINLMSAVQEGAFKALEQAIDPATCPVLDHVQQDAAPNFIKLGEIACVNQGTKDDQLEGFEFEVHTIFLGKDRSVIIDRMHLVREALDEQLLAVDGVSFSSVRFISAAVSDPEYTPKGPIYAGLSTFEVDAEPA